MQQIVKTLVLLAVFCFQSPAYSADATTFNPIPITISGQASGVPVGTIIPWISHSLPGGADAGKWLFCHGQPISSAAYPDLVAFLGTHVVPDLRGQFLRGLGGNSASLGQRQDDALSANQKLTFTLDADLRPAARPVSNYTDKEHGRSRSSVNADYLFLATHNYIQGRHGWMEVPASKSPIKGKTATITGNISSNSPETRPVNTAVNYIVRAVK